HAGRSWPRARATRTRWWWPISTSTPSTRSARSGSSSATAGPTRTVPSSRPDVPDLAVVSRRVVTPDGLRDAAVLVEGGRIVGLAERSAVPPGCAVLDATDRVVMPGLVDAHVHVNEPGRTEWEGFETATRAAAAGGVTTLVDMPLNSIPATTTLAALLTKAEAMEGKCWIDVGLWGGAVPGNARELNTMLDHGALGFKCFLADSGVDEFPHVGERDLRDAMPVIARLGLPLLVHAELPGPIDAA